MSLRFITPLPLATKVRSSSVPVVMSVATPLKVRVPVEVIAPEEIVPILVRLPVESILCVPPVKIAVIASSTLVVVVPDAVIFNAPEIVPVLEIPPELLFMPLVTFNPLDAVKSPADVIVPVPVVEILFDVVIVPEVERSPFSLIVNLVFPPD